MPFISVPIRTALAALVLAGFVSACSSSNDSNAPPGPPADVKSEIVRLDITSKVSPAFGGKSFGSVGQYELLVGTAHGVADPGSARNTSVTDLSGAPRNDKGLVEYSMDIAILKPIDQAKANGTMIYEVGNRGNKSQMRLLYGSAVADFTKPEGAGEGFGFDKGYTMVWSGWMGELTSTQDAVGGGAMAASFPTAKAPDGSSITGTVRDEFTLDGQTGPAIPAIPTDATSFNAPLYYLPVDSDVSRLKLTVREHADDAPVLLPSSQMEFIDPKTLRIQLAQGYDLGAIYDVTYTARDPRVSGLSFVSMRDFVSFLRNSAADHTGMPSPLAVSGRSSIDKTIAIGLSQSGRFQRDFIYLDFNVDEDGRRVFDGMLPQGAGAKRGFFHQRFAEATRSPDVQHENRGYPGASFPFTYPVTTDPITGKTDGILARCAQSQSCPKVMHIDSDWEQWQQAASLVVTDTSGNPVQLPENVRAYYLTATPHSSGPGIAVPNWPAAGICEYARNPLSWQPVFRALVVAMEDWVTTGTLPPASRYPASAAEGRVSISALQAAFPNIPGYDFNPLYGKLQLIDFDKDPPQLISASAPYPIHVMRVDQDGNPFDGVVLPEVTVPIATYSGRNTRGANNAPGDLCGTQGAVVPFPLTASQRQATGDPRLSIAERYASNADYQTRLTSAANQLAAERLMLPGDASKYSSFALPQPQ